jgi:RecA/RadA recombinase
MALATGLRGDPIAEVTLKESSGDTAVVVVKVKDVEREQKMVREDGKWRLDLLALLP